MNNPELELAHKFVQLTNRNIFLTGKAGTGKTTFLKSLKGRLNKRMVVTAPTGVAAINAGGVTLHSFFQLPFGPIITEKAAGHKVDNPNFKQKFNKQKINIIKTLDLLIIDEISMVRADVLDAIDEVLRRYKNRLMPFGGVQLLMIGDIQQLAPVVKREEEALLGQYYKSAYFFNSIALNEARPVSIELKHVYRQSDDAFIHILNEVRDNMLSPESYQKLHERYIPGFDPENKEGYISLTTHNRAADAINSKKLAQIKAAVKKFEASIEGKFPEHAYPTDYLLHLKKGAQVMFIKNDSAYEKRYYNGKIGIVTGFEDEKIMVQCKGEDSPIAALPEVWENIRYAINPDTKEISENFIGSFTQYPLRTAWAVTIHKSQGLTFEKAVIDAADAFAHGQTYVALSRCKTLEGMVLSSKISESAIICDREVRDFNAKNRENEPDENALNQSKYAYQREILEELFNFRQVNYHFKKLHEELPDDKENRSGNLSEIIAQIVKKDLPETSKIAQTFTKQIRQVLRDKPDAEENQTLHDRLEKAAEFFKDAIRKKITKPIETSTFESDNKGILKAVNDRLATINELLHVKRECLNAAAANFNTEKYLRTRAKALLEKPAQIKAQSQPKEIETRHQSLYNLLKEWRLIQAEKEDVPAFRILPNYCLQEIANRLPVTSPQLKTIKGIGKKKLEHYGQDLIAKVESWCDENDVIPDESEPQIPEKKPKKKPNKEISFEMYKAGKSIEEIAEAQGFVTSTIESHLANYVGSGELDVKEFVSADNLAEISEYFKTQPEAKLSEAKEALPDRISWSDLHFVRKHLEDSGEKEKT